MTVVAQGKHIATWVNGVQTVDWTDNRPLKDNARNGCRLEAGPISLQGHDPTTDLSFRNIRIADLSVRQTEKPREEKALSSHHAPRDDYLVDVLCRGGHSGKIDYPPSSGDARCCLTTPINRRPCPGPPGPATAHGAGRPEPTVTQSFTPYEVRRLPGEATVRAKTIPQSSAEQEEAQHRSDADIQLPPEQAPPGQPHAPWPAGLASAFVP